MDEHIILQVLKDLNINSEPDVEKRLAELDSQSVGLVLNKMENWYRTQGASALGKKAKNSIFGCMDTYNPKRRRHLRYRI